VSLKNGRNYLQEVITSAHGYGLMGVSITADPFPLDRRVFNAFNDVRDRFINNHDLNARHFVDISWAQPAIGNST
jgi:hypothetical protein